MKKDSFQLKNGTTERKKGRKEGRKEGRKRRKRRKRRKEGQLA